MADRGVSTTEESAKTEALAALARYVGMTVNANLTTAINSIDTGSSLNEGISVQNTTQVTATVSLFGVEYTQPYFLKSEKKYYCVAYVERDRAWQQYVPKIENEKNIFYGFYKKAQTEKEPLFKCSYYKSAWEKGKDFLTALEYGRLIHPAREAAYSSDRALLSQIPSLIESEKKVISIKVLVTGDYGNIIKTAVSEAFRTAGYTISENGNCTANVTVDSNEIGKDPVAIFPSVDLKLNGVTGATVYSYQQKISQKTAAYSLETAQKKAFPLLGELIKAQVPSDLAKQTEAKK